MLPLLPATIIQSRWSEGTTTARLNQSLQDNLQFAENIWIHDVVGIVYTTTMFADFEYLLCHKKTISKES